MSKRLEQIEARLDASTNGDKWLKRALEAALDALETEQA